MASWNRFRTMSAILVAAVAGTVVVRGAISTNRPPSLSIPSVLNLGHRERGEIVLARFPVGNHGGRPLVLENFKTSCSCAGVEREENGKFAGIRSVEVPPGETVQLAVRISVAAPYGQPQLVRVFFEANDPTQRANTVEFQIPLVRGGVLCLPTVAMFGVVPTGGETTRTIDLYDAHVKGRTVGAVRSRQPDRFDARFVPLAPGEIAPLQPNVGALIGRLEVTARTDRSGPLDGDVEIAVSGEDRRPDVLPVVGEVVGEFDCRPRQLYLPRSVGTGYSFTGEVFLAAEDGKSIQVTVGRLPPYLSATVRPQPGRADQAVLVVTYDLAAAARASAPKATSLRLTVAIDRRESEVEIPIVVGEKPS